MLLALLCLPWSPLCVTRLAAARCQAEICRARTRASLKPCGHGTPWLATLCVTHIEWNEHHAQAASAPTLLLMLLRGLEAVPVTCDDAGVLDFGEAHRPLVLRTVILFKNNVGSDI